MSIILGLETCVHVFLSKEWSTVDAFNNPSRFGQMNTLVSCKSTGSGVEVHTLADLGVTYSPLHNPDLLAE